MTPHGEAGSAAVGSALGLNCEGSQVENLACLVNDDSVGGLERAWSRRNVEARLGREAVSWTWECDWKRQGCHGSTFHDHQRLAPSRNKRHVDWY
jgi:hypothetical protein